MLGLPCSRAPIAVTTLAIVAFSFGGCGGIGGPDLPVEVSAIDSYGAPTDAPERALTVVSRLNVSLTRILRGEELLCDPLDRCLEVSRFLLDRVPDWQ